MTQRVYAAALLHKGTTTVRNYGNSKDELAALDIIQKMGAELSFEGSIVQIKSSGLIKKIDTINCGESGLSARLFTPIAALSEQLIKIEGKGSLLSRPMIFLKDVLEELEVELPDFKGYIPFSVCGPLKAKNIVVDGRFSSQLVSGLLLAFSNAATEKTEIKVLDLVSKPYLDLTLEVLELFGKKILHTNYQNFIIDPSSFIEKESIDITIEGDWSSAAFWIAAATIKGSVSLVGLNRNSTQADKIILDIVSRIGAQIVWEKEFLEISSGGLNAFEADLSDAPDLFPVLSIVAACCTGTSKLIGLHRLIHKESNRAESITDLLNRLGVIFSVYQDTLIIEGCPFFKTIRYECPNDHRMAMAAALTAMRSGGAIEIANAESVDKSYPDFWKRVSVHAKFLNFC